MPKVTPQPGQAVEETTVTRILADTKGDPDKPSTDPLEYMDLLSAEKWASGNHIVYLYRVEPPLYRGASGPAYVTKYSNPITLDDIQREYGGGIWRVLVKRGQERIADQRYQVMGTPRDLTRNVQEFAPAASGGVPAENNGVISQAMTMVSNPTAQAAQVDMLRTSAAAAIDMVKANAAPQLGIRDIIELLDRQRPQEKPFLETPLGTVLIAAATALVNRLVTPTDPLEQMAKYADIMSKLGGNGSTSDWKAAMVNALPQIATAVKDTVQEMRLGTEAQMRMSTQRTLPPAPAAPPVASAQNPAPPQNVVEMPQQPQGAQPMEPFELKLIELLNDPQMTGDKAGEILDQQWPRFVDEIAGYNVDQILVAFNHRPILAPHAKNPRLRQFITEFLQWANEVDTPPSA